MRRGSRFHQLLIVCALAALLVQPRSASAQAQIKPEVPVRCYGEGITTGPDGNLWVAGTPCSRIARITPAGRLSEFLLPENSQPVGIVAGPDGNLWFTIVGRNALGRMTPRGAYTEFPLGLQGFAPGGPTLGPDGNFWLTYAHGIARVSLAGAVTTFPIQGYALNSGITTGPDGNLWFTTGEGIGRITPDGDLTLFSTGFSSYGIVSGPDGNLWFTNYRGIGRSTPDGEITFFPTPLLGEQQPPFSNIVIGPDGNLWFGMSRPNPDTLLGLPFEVRLARMTLDGEIVTYSLGWRFDPGLLSLTVGPDGQIWFYRALHAAGRRGLVGRLNLASLKASRPALVAVSQQIGPVEQARPGGTLTYTIVAGNYGRGDAEDATIIMPLDPGAVQLIDASFSRPTAWVSRVLTDSLTIQTGPLDRDGDVVTGTVRLRVLDSAAAGARLAPRLLHTWRDERGGGSGRSNQLPLVVTDTGEPQNLYPLAAEAGEEAAYRFASGVFVPGEPVAFWYNTPEGAAVAAEGGTADDEGAVSSTLPREGLSPGAYSMVARGRWSQAQAVVPFQVEP
ncbi:MAG TPA: hypothetical protein VFS21_04465 [Roseiflexaceae bacterium]|nr:hypothetical protein [Roseiflexaceae bacterium]